VEDRFPIQFPLRIVDRISQDEEQKAWGPFLRKAGVSYELRLKPGHELLMDAIRKEDVDAVTSILANSKDIDKKWTASHTYLMVSFESEYGKLDFARAALEMDNADKRRTVAKALAKAGVDFNKKHDAHSNWNLAHIYGYHARPEVLRLAIECGADPHATDGTPKRRTPYVVIQERLQKESLKPRITDLQKCAVIVGGGKK